MSEVNLNSIFSSLETQAKQLNEISDEANHMLSMVEQRLIDLNIGLEIWYSDPLERSDSEGNISSHETSTERVKFLGFARTDGKWCFAVKTFRIVNGFYQGDMDCPFQNNFAEGQPVPLLKQSRDLRIRALEVLPKFLEKIDKDIKTKIHDLEIAKSRLNANSPELRVV